MSILYEERLQLIRNQPMKPRHNLRPEKIGLLEWLGCRSSLSSCFENVLISKNSVSSSINDDNVKVLVIHLSHWLSVRRNSKGPLSTTFSCSEGLDRNRFGSLQRHLR